VRDLDALLRFPTVSSDAHRARDIRACAGWLADRSRAAGLHDVRLVPGRRHPAVLAHRPAAPGHRTLLLYTHYDVQPPGPRAAWRTDPFLPTVRNGRIHARGASDDKGQLLAHLIGTERALARGASTGVVLLFDGEEEIGSPSLPDVLRDAVGPLAPDAALISDTRMIGPGRPAFVAGLRGSLGVELEVRGPPRELHSGRFGGAVTNPVEALCEMLAALHDADRRIALPGFYAAVRRPPRFGRPPPAALAVLRQAGVDRGRGERGFSAYARTTSRPSLTINGVRGGNAEAPNAAIPASARAQLSFRLVADQRPDEVERQLMAQLAELVPRGATCRVTRHGSSRPVLLDPRDALHRTLAAACRDVWGRPPAVVRSGGSIRAAELFTRHGLPTALLGFAPPDDNAHGPNEWFSLENLELGARTVAATLLSLSMQARAHPSSPTSLNRPRVVPTRRQRFR
jgi:acetylornithine deacetylase/succinyl-diaminopimelate desuccinylase-like protein